jgi:hypothetical protein
MWRYGQQDILSASFRLPRSCINYSASFAAIEHTFVDRAEQISNLCPAVASLPLLERYPGP